MNKKLLKQQGSSYISDQNTIKRLKVSFCYLPRENIHKNYTDEVDQNNNMHILEILHV